MAKIIGNEHSQINALSSNMHVDEIRKIISEQYEVTKKTLEKNRDLLDLIANALIEHETITKEQIDYLVVHKVMPDEDNEKDYSDFKEVSLRDLTLVELKNLAKEKEIKGYTKMTKEELIKELEDK